MLHTVSRLGALFGVSILEDNGHARNDLWDIVYHMSSVICKFSSLSIEYISLKSQENRGFLSNVVLNPAKESGQRIRPKAYLISGMKYYCLYHIIITSIDHINISFILAVVVVKI
jgi:hypothetical protein